MQALDFTEEDLIANQNGLLGAHQKGVLQRFLQRGIRLSIIGVIGIVALGVFLWSLHYDLFLGFFVIFLCFWFTIFGYLNRLVNVYLDMRSPQVSTAEGSVELAIAATNKPKIKLGAQLFSVPSHQSLLAFKNHDPYRIYYLSISLTLLSVEWLRDDDPFADDA
ncbi:MAG: hypothetical protein MUF87_21795 [Anaerolineae bacterium]|jgi:hypothetical protein|nr:hypothetical protein [Anaerolineae bacterium]